MSLLLENLSYWTLTIRPRIEWLFKTVFKEYNILIYADVFQSARTKENEALHSAVS